MVQPQRVSASNTASSSSSTVGLFRYMYNNVIYQPQNQNRGSKHGSTNNNKKHLLLRIAMISCSVVVLVYVVVFSTTTAVFDVSPVRNNNNERQVESSSTVRANNRKEVDSHQNQNAKNHVNLQQAITKTDNLQIAIDVARNNNKNTNNQQDSVLVLTTKVGMIRIVLRPDLSPESVSYLQQIATAPNGCGHCNLYRAEKPGILQGIIESANPSTSIDVVKGSCPVGFETVANECPPWDSNCQCHGPVMTKGMVGWAAGATGPDFFIDNYERPAQWWGTQHTVFGIITDDASLSVISTIFNTIPTHDVSGLTHLVEPLHFTIRLE